MKAIIFAGALALGSSAALAAGGEYRDVTVLQEVMQPVKFHGKMIQLHMMKMADGSVVYAMSKEDLERFLQQRVKTFSTYNP